MNFIKNTYFLYFKTFLDKCKKSITKLKNDKKSSILCKISVVNN